MAFQRGNRTGAGHRRLVALLALLSVVLPVSAQTESDESDFSPFRLGTPQVVSRATGEPIEIVYYISDVSPDQMEVLGTAYPAGVVVVDGPFVVGRDGRDTRIELRVVVRDPGRFVLSLPDVLVAGRELDAPEMLLEIFDEEQPGIIPFGVRWRPLVTEFYRGQSIPLILELFNSAEFTYPRGIAVSSPESGLFEEVTGLGSVRTKQIGDRELFEFPIAAFLFTPSETGSVDIPGVQIGSAGEKRRIDPLTLDIMDVPSEIAASSAVGQFDLSIALDSESVAVGETVELRMTLSGRGNLPVVQFPETTTTGLAEIERREESNLQADTETLLGYMGDRELVVLFEVTGQDDDTTISISDFVQFNPLTQAISRTPRKEYSLEVSVEEPELQRKLDLELITIEELASPVWIQFYNRSWVYVFFLLPPVFVVVRELVRRRRGVAALSVSIVLLLSSALFPELNLERLGRAQDLIARGEADTAGVLYDLEIQDRPYHAGLRHNRSILAVRSGRPSLAVFEMRRAIYLRPSNQRFRSELAQLEQLYDLEDQPSIPRVPRADIWLFSLAAVWVLFWLVSLAKRGAVRSIVLFVLGLLLALSTVALFVSASVERRPDATVVDDVVVRRIPDDQARPWVSVSAANSVMVELSYGRFLLVRTRSGVEGWVPESALFFEGTAR